MKQFPKSAHGIPWRDAVAEGRKLAADMLKNLDVESLVDTASEATSRCLGCAKRPPGTMVVIPVEVMRLYSSLAAMMFMEELARREAEFNRAAQQ